MKLTCFGSVQLAKSSSCSLHWHAIALCVECHGVAQTAAYTPRNSGIAYNQCSGLGELIMLTELNLFTDLILKAQTQHIWVKRTTDLTASLSHDGFFSTVDCLA